MIKSDIYEFSAGEVILWAESGEPIMLKAISSHRDPVELNSDEARKIADALNKLADWCDRT